MARINMKLFSSLAIAVSMMAVGAFAQMGGGMGPKGEGMMGPGHEQGEWGEHEGMEMGQHHGMGMELMNPKVMLELGMSLDQQAKLKAYHEQNKGNMEASMKESKQLRKDLIDGLAATPIDNAKVDKARTGLIAQETKKLDMQIAMGKFFASLLTPEQHKKMIEIIAKHEEQQQKREKMMEEHMKQSEANKDK